MSWPSSIRKWLPLPSRIALLIGFGALSAAGAKADTAQPTTRAPQQSAKSFGELRIWSDAGRIYVSEADKETREIELGNTPEARHLRELLERDGAGANSPRVLHDRMILVGGGGAGFDWAPADRHRTTATPAPPAATRFGRVNPSVPAQTTPPANSQLPPRMSTRTPERG